MPAAGTGKAIRDRSRDACWTVRSSPEMRARKVGVLKRCDNLASSCLDNGKVGVLKNKI